MLAALLLTFQSITLGAQCPPAQSAGFHVVQKGETLYYLSRLYNVSVDQLCQWNNIQKTDVIKLCTQLRVWSAAGSGQGTEPAAGTPSDGSAYSPQQGDKHVVGKGETVEGIARLYGYTAQRFRNFNNLKPNEAVSPGRVLFSSDCQCPDPSNPGQTMAPASYDEFQPAIVQETAPAQEAAPVQGKLVVEDPYMPGQTLTKTIEQQPGNTVNQPTTPDQKQAGATDQAAKPAEENGYVAPEDVLIGRKQSAGKPASNGAGTTKPASQAAAPKAVAPYMSSDEIAMVNEINLLRFDPKGYVPVVEEYMAKVKAGQVPGKVETCKELIEELKKTAALPALETMECIYRAAKLHGQEQAPKGVIDHIGKGGTYPWDRIRQACPSLTDGNENLVGGPSAVRDAVLLLLVDEGIANRGHRRNLLNPDWRFVACYYVGKVGSMPNYWIQNFGK